MQRLRPTSVLRWLLALMLVLAGTVTRPPVAVAEPTVATRIADQTFAGVHLVIDTWEMTATIPVLGVSESAMETLKQKLTEQIASGSLPETEEAIVQAIVDAIEASPDTYFVPTGETRSTKAQISALGTGWTITPDGHLITAAHVVDKSDTELAEGVGQNALQQLLEQDLKVFAADQQWTEEQVKQLGVALHKIYSSSMKLSDVKHSVAVRFEEPGEGGKVGREVPARIIDKGTGFPGPDWAILKVDGEENLPTIRLGKSGDVVTGAEMFIVGYPAEPTFFPGASVDSTNTPTITSGSVTGVKSTAGEVPVFQTQAPATNGNSGGPTFNAQGEAVGILVAGSRDRQTGAGLDGQAWVIQISVVEEELAEHGITPAESETTKVYNEALEEFYVNHFTAAKEKFERVKELYPGHPYVTGFIEKSQQGIDEGRDETPPPPVEEPQQANGPDSTMWVWIGMGVCAVLLVVVVIAVLVSGRRRRSALPPPQPPQGWGPPGPGGGYPYRG